MALAIASVHDLPAWIEWLGRRPGVLATLAAICFAGEVALLGRAVPLAWTPGQWIGRFVLGGLLSFFLVAIAVVGPQDVGLVRRVLRHPIVAWVGSVSYGIYLWHQTVLTLLFQALGGGKGPIAFLELAGAGVPLATAVAGVSWYVLERPLLAWAQRR